MWSVSCEEEVVHDDGHDEGDLAGVVAGAVVGRAEEEEGSVVCGLLESSKDQNL